MDAADVQLTLDLSRAQEEVMGIFVRPLELGRARLYETVTRGRLERDHRLEGNRFSSDSSVVGLTDPKA